MSGRCDSRVSDINACVRSQLRVTFCGKLVGVDLVPGLYETLITEQLREVLDALVATGHISDERSVGRRRGE